ncbi:MAG: hypothetical protein CV087_20205 [Candidatus Brocadia sp. WS118]|nr:MAG: hypothetical protein CV087_20205 [Candidatus Brocadia sp. WS118]
MSLDTRIYRKLMETAQRAKTITYTEVGNLVGLDMDDSQQREELAHLLGNISRNEHENHRPLLSVVVVHASGERKGIPGSGFFSLASELEINDGRDEDMFFAEELKRVFDFWAQSQELPDDLQQLFNDAPLRNIHQQDDELPDDDSIYEGAKRRITVNSYERSPEARAKCIKHYGAVCQACGFDFGKRYGEIGRGYIHVHHLVPLPKIGGNYQVDPINDLRPVCANCHAIIHRPKEEPLTIEKVRELLENQAKITEQ